LGGGRQSKTKSRFLTPASPGFGMTRVFRCCLHSHRGRDNRKPGLSLPKAAVPPLAFFSAQI
jgi:hypothetical protein